jgi:hypothetical protein
VTTAAQSRSCSSSKHPLHAVIDFISGDITILGAFRPVTLKIAQALGAICGFHAIHDESLNPEVLDWLI